MIPICQAQTSGDQSPLEFEPKLPSKPSFLGDFLTGEDTWGKEYYPYAKTRICPAWRCFGYIPNISPA
eukprot:2460403-Amphidinium_carterae.1